MSCTSIYIATTWPTCQGSQWVKNKAPRNPHMAPWRGECKPAPTRYRWWVPMAVGPQLTEWSFQHLCSWLTLVYAGLPWFTYQKCGDVWGQWGLPPMSVIMGCTEGALPPWSRAERDCLWAPVGIAALTKPKGNSWIFDIGFLLVK